MTSRITRAALPVVVASALTTLATSAPAQDKPNIVIIMTDNLGYGDLGVTTR